MGTLAVVFVLSLSTMAFAGCSSHNADVPQTLDEQRRDLQGPGQIPPGVLAQMRAKYGQGGSYQQQVQAGVGKAASAKQGANGQVPSSQLATAPHL